MFNPTQSASTSSSSSSSAPVSVPVQGGGSEEPKSLDVPVQGPVSSASGPVDDEPSVDTNDGRRVKPRLSELYSLTYEIHDTVGDEGDDDRPFKAWSTHDVSGTQWWTHISYNDHVDPMESIPEKLKAKQSKKRLES